MNAEHTCQAVLPDAGGVHPQLQVGIDISVKAHSFALVEIRLQHPAGSEEAVTAT